MLFFGEMDQLRLSHIVCIPTHQIRSIMPTHIILNTNVAAPPDLIFQQIQKAI